jgi:hypothetical protein
MTVGSGVREWCVAKPSSSVHVSTFSEQASNSSWVPLPGRTMQQLFVEPVHSSSNDSSRTIIEQTTRSLFKPLPVSLDAPHRQILIRL